MAPLLLLVNDFIHILRHDYFKHGNQKNKGKENTFTFFKKKKHEKREHVSAYRSYSSSAALRKSIHVSACV